MDKTGAVIPNAVVTATNDATGIAVQTKSNGTGNFSFTDLRPGRYSVKATAKGFKSTEITHVLLTTDAMSSVNFKLEPGTVEQVVQVRAKHTLINTTSVDRGETFSAAEIDQAPLNGGNPIFVAQTAPGVYFNSYMGWERPFDNNAMNQWSVNGQASDSNDFQIDGTPDNSVTWGGRNIAAVPPEASILEMKVITNPYDAQYGHTGGAVFDMVTKYGTNKFHGQVYENMRRTWLDANSHVNDALNLPKGKYWIDQYGVEADGPVVIPHLYNGHNKTFFMLQYEGYRFGQPDTFVDSVPPLDPNDPNKTVIQTGNFSQDYYWDGSCGCDKPTVIYNPFTSGNTVNGVADARYPFPNNQIPTTLLDPVAQKILSYLPKPNRPTASGLNWGVDNHVAQIMETDKFRNVVARVDHNFGPNDKVYLRFLWNKRFEFRPYTGVAGPGSTGTNPLIRQNHSFAFDWMHVFNANTSLDLHLSFNRYVDNERQGISPFNLSQLGWPSSYDQNVPATQFPEIDISEYTGLGDAAGNGGNRTSISNSLGGLPVLTMVRGNHTINIGADIRLMRSSAYQGGAASGQLYVDRQWTQAHWYYWGGPAEGNSWASMLLGTMTNGHLDYNSNLYFSYPYIAPYVQDNWKVTNKLTLDLGLRWDLVFPPTEMHNRIVGAFDTTSVNPVNASIPAGALDNITLLGGNTYAGVNGQPRTLFNFDPRTLQPRVGFAYMVTPMTVVRGGFGTSYVSVPDQGYSQGFNQVTGYVASLDGGQTPLVNLDNPFPVIQKPLGAKLGLLNDVGNSFSVFNRHFKIPAVLNFSLGVEHQFGPHTLVDVSFVGSDGYDQPTNDNINRISASFAAHCNLEMGASASTYENCINYPTSAGQPEWIQNPFKGVQAFQNSGNTQGYYTNQYLSANVLTRRFPEFGDIYENGLNDGQTFYNSLQIIVTHRASHSLIFHASYVRSKSTINGGYVDQTYRVKAHYLSLGDKPNRITFNGVWYLPFGRGHYFFRHANRLVNEAVGGWVLSPIYVYETGTPWGIPGNIEVLRKQHYGVHNVVEGGVPLIRGTGHCIEWYDPNKNYQLDLVPGSLTQGCSVGNADFRVRPAYGVVRDVPFPGVRQPDYTQFDLSLSKYFNLVRGMRLETRIEGFNALNHPTWDEGYWGDPRDPHFGTINLIYSGQSNLPRQVQLTAKVVW